MADDDYTNLQNPPTDYAESQNPASLYGANGGQTPANASKPKLKTPINGEVTILASFVWKPPIDGATEIDHFLKGKWHPGYADYVEITGTKMNVSPGNLIAFMCQITEYEPKSIKRLNFFTHANKKVIGIEGYMDSTDVHFNNSVDETEIAGYASAGLSFKYNNQNFTLDDVRGRFADDAIFVLYGCDIAFDPATLLTALKNLFQVTAIGFNNKTVFCPPAQTVGGTDFKRMGEKMGIMKQNFKCDVDSTRDWRSLIRDPNAVEVPK